MNADLEATLAELGGEYREMVVKMKAAYEPLPARAAAERPSVRRGRIIGWSAAYLAAASLLVLVGLGVLFGGGAGAPAAVDTNAFMLAHLKSAAAVDEMIRTQRPDGGWGNDFLTRQNAEALARRNTPEARLAVRKAHRNLRLNGKSL